MLLAVGKLLLSTATYSRSVLAMAPIATYVFLDLETTGLPREENNKTKITELSLVAVKRDHVLDTRPGAVPRVQHKLTLCFNPRKMVHPGCTQVTGLCNDLLEHEPTFNTEVFTMLNNFLNILSKPVCLIAQNGHNFDFPILKNHLEKLNVGFGEHVMCADCYHAFYDILEAANKANALPELPKAVNSDPQVVSRDETDLSLQTDTNGAKSLSRTSDGASDLLALKDTLSMKSINESTPKQGIKMAPATLSSNTLNERILKHIEMAPDTLPMKSINETTPKQVIKVAPATQSKEDKSRVSKARRRFPWSQGSKPTQSYKLKDIYERVLNRPGLDAHRAESDCIMALECSVALAKQFVEWVDENHVPFTDIKPMTIGVPLGQ